MSGFSLEALSLLRAHSVPDPQNTAFSRLGPRGLPIPVVREQKEPPNLGARNVLVTRKVPGTDGGGVTCAWTA